MFTVYAVINRNVETSLSSSCL